MIQVHLTRKTVPDEDPEQTLLMWLAERGFHDVLALRADASFESKLVKRRPEGLDLCLWVDPERLLRAAINKDPTNGPPKHAKDLSNEERSSLVQAATSVLAEAKDNKILSYKEMFLLHEQTTLKGLLRLQGPYRMFWDRGDVLLDAIASYFGTKVGYYFAWLKFYTAALVFPTVIGLWVWWTEGVNAELENSGVCVPVVTQQAAPGVLGVPLESWWRWPVAVAVSLADSTLRKAPAAVAGAKSALEGGAGAGEEAAAAAAGGASARVGGVSGVNVGGDGGAGWDVGPVGDLECEVPTSLAPYFNLFLAVWATLFLVMWKRRSNTLAFRWGVHKEDTIERAKFMAGWKRHDRPGLTATGVLQRQTSFSSTASTATTATLGSSSSSGGGSSSGRLAPSTCKLRAKKEGLRRQCATGGFRATAAAVAAASAADRAVTIKENKWAVFGRGGGAVVREDGLEGGAWEPLRTARLFLSWGLEAGLVYLAVRMMLFFAWLEVRSLAKFGRGSFGVHLVRTASVILPSTFYGAHLKWAQALTTWEGHVTEAAAENSMTVKRFTFGCVNSFSRLFYLGFWQRDLVGLKDMLMTVLITRSFVDALQEVVAPMIQVYWRKRLQRATARAGAPRSPKEGDRIITHHQEEEKEQPRRRAWCQFFQRQQHPHQHWHGRNQEVSFRAKENACQVKKKLYRDALMHERMLPEYQTQHEYLALMVQYGYVTMFAVAFPLAPLLALVRCLAEIYIDHRKLLRCRRPAYIDRSSIGAWYGVLEFVGTASVLTNCLLLALTAEKLRLYIPAPLETQFPNAKYIVMAVFAEHMILGVKAAVRVLIDDVPDGVERAMAEELLHDQEESRRKMEVVLGFEEDIAPTQVTIIRQHQHQQRQQQAADNKGGLTARGGSTSIIYKKGPLSANSMKHQHHQHLQGMPDNSSWHSNGSASSVHLLSSSLQKARAVEPPQRTPLLRPLLQQKPKPSRRTIWSRRSSRPIAPYDDLDDNDADTHSLAGGRERYRAVSGSVAGPDSPGRWSDAGGAVRGHAGGRGAQWETASVDGGGGGGGSQWKAPSAAQRSVFSESGTGPRRRISFRRSSS
eukprot:g8591.t1